MHPSMGSVSSRDWISRHRTLLNNLLRLINFEILKSDITIINVLIALSWFIKIAVVSWEEIFTDGHKSTI